MKEVAISAAAIVGLFGFAALYQSNNQHRARRDLFEIEIDDFAAVDPFASDKYGFHSDLDNMTRTDWETFMSEANVDKKVWEAGLVEDVQVKNRAFARVNFNKLEALMPSFNREHARRRDLLNNFMAGRGSNLANDSPNVLDQQRDNGQADGDNVNYFDGADNTHPKIERILEENGWDDRHIGLDQEATSQTQVWFMFPAAVPMFYEKGNDAKDSFIGYWEFVMKMKDHLPMDRSVRISIGLWAKGAVFTPRGSKLHARLPWARIARYYKRPRATAAQPNIMATVSTLTQYTKGYGPSSANVGSNCIVFWFHHDVASDLAKVVSPQGYDAIRTLNSQCTVLHTFVGMGDKAANMDYLNLLVPSLSSRVPIDSDFNQGFFLNSIEDLNTEAQVRQYYRFLRIITNRQFCRCFRAGWTPPPTQPEITIVPNTEGPGWEGTEAPEMEKLDYGEGEVSEYDMNSGTAAPTYDTYASEMTEGSDMRGVDEEDTTPKVPEIDTCCGHGSEGVAYDSELRVCCEDGSTKPHEEYDPCSMDMGTGFY